MKKQLASLLGVPQQGLLPSSCSGLRRMCRWIHDVQQFNHVAVCCELRHDVGTLSRFGKHGVGI